MRLYLLFLASLVWAVAYAVRPPHVVIQKVYYHEDFIVYKHNKEFDI